MDLAGADVKIDASKNFLSADVDAQASDIEHSLFPFELIG
jgi:hypothetical protein